MICRRMFKGLLVGGLVGFVVVQYIWRRGRVASDEAVTELRFAPSKQPAAPPAVNVPTTNVEPQVVETVVVEPEPTGREESTGAGDEEQVDDVRTEVSEIDEANEDEVAEPDDLRKIEGIGPKISDILNESGIYTYAQLAASEVGDLRSILTDAGSRFRLADPKTWPQQAQFAANGDWDGLQALQDSLKHGR